MAIENTYLLGKNITLGCGFDLQAKAPLDSRQVVPSFAGLQALINGDAGFEGLIVYDEETKKTYQAQKCDPYTVEVDGKTKTYDITFREFGINESELRDLIASETTAAMEFKGVTATLPENPSKGDMYKVAGENISIKIDDVDAKLGDSIVYNGEQWFLIPSGDDIEDTWRPVTDVNNDATLTFAAGDKLDVTVASTGTVTYKHEAIDAPELLAENEQTRTYITAVETDGYGHITGYKTATEHVIDTDTTYTFEGVPTVEGESAPSSVYFNVTSSEENADPVTVYLDAYSKNEADTAFKTKQTAYSAEGSDKKTITKVTQNANGEVEVTYGDIDFSHNHDEQYKKLQDAITAVATETNVFVDTVAQNENGEIEITTKAVDFTAVNDAIDTKLNANGWTDAANGWTYGVDEDGEPFDVVAGINNRNVYFDNYDKHVGIGIDTGVIVNESGVGGTEVTTAGISVTSYEPGYATKLSGGEVKHSVLLDSGEEGRFTSYGIDGITYEQYTYDEDDNVTTNLHVISLPNKSGTLATTDDITAAANELSGEIAKKVDAVEGKDLIATSEIERLASVDNYDDTEVRGLISDAKTEAANQDAVVLAESQKYTDTLANGAVATNAGNIETLFEMFQWGSF